MNMLMLAVGGALGACLRYGLQQRLNPIVINSLPIGTLLANIIGACLIGVFYVIIVERAYVDPSFKPLLIAGLLGAFTTFSSFSLEAILLLESGRIMLSLIYIIASVLICLLVTTLALFLTRLLF